MTASHASPGAPMPHRRRLTTGAVLVGALLLLAAIVFVAWSLTTVAAQNRQLQRDESAQSAAITQLSTALNQTRTQLTDHGITPKAPPPSSIVQGVPGAAGSVGPAGPSGAVGVPGVAGSPGPVGPSGSPGSVGAGGSVGPAGPAGPAGVAGAAGQDGQDGKDGTQGATGPAPSGWTFTASDGTVYDCTPDSPGSTHYQCTPESGTGPQPPSSPSPSPQPSSTGASNAAYMKRNTVVVATGPRWP